MITEIDLRKKAIAMFQDWATNALRYHTDLNLKIKEYDVFETDLRSAMDSAKESLFKDKHDKDRKIAGYDYGYMRGYIQSNLNAKWNSEYIAKQSNEYKTFAAIKALESYLEFDTLLALMMNKLYQAYYERDINVEHINTNIKIDLKKEIGFLSHELTPQKNDF